ncbi:unnamed protein product [Knipowitschia caucasica]
MPKVKPRSGRFQSSEFDSREKSAMPPTPKSPGSPTETKVKPALAPKPCLKPEVSTQQSEKVVRGLTPPSVAPPAPPSIKEELTAKSEQDSSHIQESKRRLDSPPPGEIAVENYGQNVRMQGTLEIKLKQGGTKVDHWEEVFAVLEADVLRLFHDRAAASKGTSRWPPISLRGALCRENVFYRRKDHTFKLALEDGSQYLFAALTKDLQHLWIRRLQNQDSDSNSEDSGRASSVNVSLEKLSDATETEDTGSKEGPDQRPETREIIESSETTPEAPEQEELEPPSSPPPKPPHTYYNRHRYNSTSEGPTAPDPESKPAASEEASRERPRISVLRRLFRK